MKTLSQHNQNMKELREMLSRKRAGVLCDKCDTEMIISGKTTTAPGCHVECPKCGERGYMQGDT